VTAKDYPAFREWLSKLWFRPGDLKRSARTTGMQGA
jgi:hypothetical protein